MDASIIGYDQILLKTDQFNRGLYLLLDEYCNFDAGIDCHEVILPFYPFL